MGADTAELELELDLGPRTRQTSAQSAVASWAQARSAGRHWHTPFHSDTDAAHFDEEYLVMELLGKGGFGEVCRGLHKSTGVEVAIKFLRMPPHCVTSAEKEEWSNKIRQEIQTMAQCSSPYIIQAIEAYEPSEPGSRWRIALELCQGRDLSPILKEVGALDESSARAVAAQLACAVLHMHSHGVVHRDLKPGNIMVDGGELDGASTAIKLIDFGLAHGLDKLFITKYTAALRKEAAAAASAAAPVSPTGRFSAAVQSFVSPKKEYVRNAVAEYTPTKQYIMNAVAEMTPSKPWTLRESSTSSYKPKAADDEVQSQRSMETLASSVSRRELFRAPPAGTRAYAAPEVIKNCEMVDVPVSSDAFSVGAIMRHCATGVAPDEDVADMLGALPSAVRMVRTCLGKRVATYRFLSQVPEERRLLIKGLTQRDPAERMTVVELCKSAYVREAPGVVGNPFCSPANVKSV